MRFLGVEGCQGEDEGRSKTQKILSGDEDSRISNSCV